MGRLSKEARKIVDGLHECYAEELKGIEPKYIRLGAKMEEEEYKLGILTLREAVDNAKTWIIAGKNGG